MDNSDLLDRMANSLAETWPLESAYGLAEKMLFTLGRNYVNIPLKEIRAAVDRAIDKVDNTDQAREARQKANRKPYEPPALTLLGGNHE